jgi:hypothetical protein
MDDGLESQYASDDENEDVDVVVKYKRGKDDDIRDWENQPRFQSCILLQVQIQFLWLQGTMEIHHLVDFM